MRVSPPYASFMWNVHRIGARLVAHPCMCQIAHAQTLTARRYFPGTFPYHLSIFHVCMPCGDVEHTHDVQPPNFTDFSADYLLVEYQCSSLRR